MIPQIKVKDVMTPSNRLVTASEDETIRDAAKKMFENNVGSVLIVRNDRLIGIFTERDIVKIISKELPLDTKLGEVMTKDVITVEPEESLSRAALLMSERNIRHLPVVKDERLEGIISARDVAKYYSEVMEEFL